MTLAMLVLAAQTVAAPALQAADTPLVQVSWLARRITEPNLVIFHIGTRPEYDSAHIAGAQHLLLRDIAAFPPEGPPLQLPDPAVLDSVLEARGVSDDTRVVLYWSSSWVSPTTRVYLTLYWIGHGARTSILDGGLAAWRAAGGAVTRDVPTAPTRGRFTPRPRADVVVEAPLVRSQIGRTDWTIVDARNREFYHGERPGNGTRSGHIPDAVSFPFTTVADSSDRFLAPDVLRRLLAEAGATPGRPIVAYCHVGQQATAVWFAARLAGYEARLYDGSFDEWSRIAAYPTVTTPASQRPR